MRKLAPVVVGLAAAFATAFYPATALGATSSKGPVWPGPRVATASARASHGLSAARQMNTPSPVTCDAGFHTVANPTVPNNSFFFASAALGPNDVWAVGAWNITTTTFDQPLAEHWNGTSWSVNGPPNPGSYWADLNGVTAISTNDVWVVGAYRTDAAGDINAFAAHWNGAGWSLTTSTPNPSNLTFLLAVNADATNDVWAVGTYFTPAFATSFTVIERWNGASWTQIASVNPTAFDNELFSVSAFGATDVWAVGSTEVSSSASLMSLAEHWNGASWTQVASGNLGFGDEIIYVNALEAGHAVGVGYGIATSGGSSVGQAWDMFASSPGSSSIHTGPQTGDNILEGIDRTGSAVWAVGFGQTGTRLPPTPRVTLAIPATWNAGTHTLTWGTPGVADNPGASNTVLNAVSAVSPYTFWGVGYQNPNSATTPDQPLTELNCANHFVVGAPPSATTGSPFSLTVTVKDSNNVNAMNYKGTVHFTSTDSGATLPADYTFVPGDLGSHTFTGVILKTPCLPSISVADLAMPFTSPGSAAVALTPGVCQSSGGTAGSRGANGSPTGTAGSRSVNQSPAGTPAPRLPRLLRAAGEVSASDLATGESQAAAPVQSQPSRTEPAAPSTATNSTMNAAPAAAQPVSHPVDRRVAASLQDPAARPWPLPLASLLLVLLAPAGLFLRRRRKRPRRS